MEKRVKGIFEEINRIFSGKTRIPKERIQYFDKDIEFYKRYCESLKNDSQSGENTLYYTLFSHFMEQAKIYASLVGEREAQCFANYREMAINLINGQAKYSTKVKNSIEGDFKEVLYQLLDNTREKLDRYGFIDELYRREKEALQDIGLTEIMPVDSREIKERTFSRNSFIFRPVPEQIAINLFWINKYWKVIGSSKHSLWLLDTHSKSGNGEEITDKEKYLSLKREEILDYVQQMITDKCEDMTFEEYILCLYGKRGSLPENGRLKIANTKMQKVPLEINNEFTEIESMYNYYFGKETITGGQLINDCLYNLYMLKEKRNVQTIKDILTRQLIELLVIDKARAVLPTYSKWGIAKDKQAEGSMDKMLVMDIPRYMKPLQVHVPQRIINDDNGQLPSYKSVFIQPKDTVKRACSTNFLFQLNTEQAKLLKKKMKARRERYKKNPTKSEKEIVQTLEYMSAVANNEMGKIPQIMDEDEETR